MDRFVDAVADFNADLWPSTPRGDGEGPSRTDTPRGEWAGMTSFVCDRPAVHPQKLTVNSARGEFRP
jgi:hypothetical protein